MEAQLKKASALKEVVDGAIAVERERCAKIAESFRPGFCGDSNDVAEYELADSIAAAIRGQR